MSKPHEIVKTGMPLAAFFRRYPDDAAAEKQWESWRWPNGPRCPHCESCNFASVRERCPMPYRSRDCRRHFSVMSHTVMHASKLGAQTWLLVLFLILSNSKGKSSVQLAADLGISQKSAWHVGHRLRKALADGSLPGFEGPVECDETFIGGKAKNIHASVRRRRIHGRGAVDKAPVVGVKDRASGKVTARPTADTTSATLTGMVADTTLPGSTVFTDGDRAYDPLKEMGYLHAKVMHSVGEYVRGPVSTNGIENYWSHLNRTYIGTYLLVTRAPGPVRDRAQLPLQPPRPPCAASHGRSHGADGGSQVAVDRTGGGWTGRIGAATVNGLPAAGGPRPGLGSDQHGT